MTSDAGTVEEYLERLPEERRAALQAVREVIRLNLPEGYEEQMQYGMIGYVVPHTLYPAGYHCDPRQPLSLAGLGSQKNYMSLYLMTVYGDPAAAQWFREAFAAAGKKLDMGKACVRFKRLDDLPLDVIGQAIARVPVADYLARYEQLRQTTASGRKKKRG
jgi:Domain of unknown function (DU1801)